MQLYHDAIEGILLVHNSCEVTTLTQFARVLEQIEREKTINSRQVGDELAVMLETQDVVSPVMGRANQWAKGSGYRLVAERLRQLTQAVDALPVDHFLELYEEKPGHYATRIRSRAWGEGVPELLGED